MQKKLLVLGFYERFQFLQVHGKGLLSLFGRAEGSVRFFAHELFVDRNITGLLESADVTGEISVRKIEQLFERIKIDGVVYHQN